MTDISLIPFALSLFSTVLSSFVAGYSFGWRSGRRAALKEDRK